MPGHEYNKHKKAMPNTDISRDHSIPAAYRQAPSRLLRHLGNTSKPIFAHTFAVIQPNGGMTLTVRYERVTSEKEKVNVVVDAIGRPSIET